MIFKHFQKYAEIYHIEIVESLKEHTKGIVSFQNCTQVAESCLKIKL